MPYEINDVHYAGLSNDKNYNNDDGIAGGGLCYLFWW